ncbi:transmembrane 7 superfamily member 3-like isoform X1 [Pieris napi]|uniref:transmembrane 7 superfamily member 3-like isoform X1 n=2 Tax=Pieris napi TaxID=78633 RepID=UPI001FBBB6B4|nr:transmembrane 7 superfamily member 3-like isoform X1 [Pieris napi]
MSSKSVVKCGICLLTLMLINNVCAQNLTLILNNTLSWGNKELYGGFINIKANSTLQVDCINENKNVSYIIFQVHSHLYNITLYNTTNVLGSSLYGTNLGLYSNVLPTIDTFFIINQNMVSLLLYVSVHGYSLDDPIPGGCNMEFPVPISPYLQTKYNNEYILVDAPPPKDQLDDKCNTIGNVVLLFYKMYLPERNFEADVYFEGIQKMLTVDNIEENGEFVPDNGLHNRRMLSAYQGVGSIYVAVAISVENASAYSVYVPTYTYACAPLVEGDCDIFDDVLSQLLLASILFIGLFVCYYGHRFFKTEMFLIGLISGGIVTYILISLMADLDRPALLGASILSGICFGAIWLLFWWFYGIPVLAVFLATLDVGFLFSAIIYYGLPGGLTALQFDVNFWTLFIFIMLTTSLLLVSMTLMSNILCCAILGAYAVVYSMDYYLGSSMKYIIINTVRRATVPKFNKAVLDPPFEWGDSLLCLLWVGLAMSGFLFQHFHNYGRPPFPPPPRSVRPVVPRSLYGATPLGPSRYPRVISRNQRSTVTSERSPLLA